MYSDQQFSIDDDGVSGEKNNDNIKCLSASDEEATLSPSMISPSTSPRSTFSFSPPPLSPSPQSDPSTSPPPPIFTYHKLSPRKIPNETQNSSSRMGSLHAQLMGIKLEKSVEEHTSTSTEKPNTPPNLILSERSLSPSAVQGDGENIQLQSSRQLKLDVGGYKFSTTITTLTSSPDSMLAAMFSGRFQLEKTDEGCVFIDRDGHLFHYILTWLRNGWLPPIESQPDLEMLLQESKFYQLQGLIDYLSANEANSVEVDLSLAPPTHITQPGNSRFSQKDLLKLVNSVPSKKKVQLCSADLSGLNLCGIALQGANLKFICLDNASIQHANLQESDLRFANLRNADLSYSDLSLSNLQGANLQNAKLQYANLQGCNLQGADLMHVSLQNANVQGANLQGANLQGANLHYTNLVGAKLQGASLHGITNVQNAKGLRR